MGLSFCSFSSGSSGNCYLIKSETTAVLVDAGISARKILGGLSQTGTTDEQLAALLLTHEHSDHIKSLPALMKKKDRLVAFANELTWQAIDKDVDPDRKRVFTPGEPFQIGDIRVNAFRVCHDAADPVGFSFYNGEKQISIVTDTGCIMEEMMEEVRNADLLVLEANHDVDMLKIGRYPWFLKQRILGDRGHLSNESAARMLVKLLSEQKKHRKILLAHLSRENNFPEMAYQTVKNILEEEDYYIGKHVELNTIVRDEVSILYQV
ncbi:MAG: MBL fold metallo-hydrolase [Anaerovoracaceae bacterium]|jgi:phosphoribosyl 1,2-cyclic phosphodiesterase